MTEQKLKIPTILEYFIGKQVIESCFKDEETSKLVLKISTKQLLLERTNEFGVNFYEIVNGAISCDSTTRGVLVRYIPNKYSNSTRIKVDKQDIFSSELTSSLLVGSSIKAEAGDVGYLFNQKHI